MRKLLLPIALLASLSNPALAGDPARPGTL